MEHHARVCPGRYTDLLAANRIAVARAPFYSVGTSLLLSAFVDPRTQDMHPDWE
jgi:hypothetical protein